MRRVSLLFWILVVGLVVLAFPGKALAHTGRTIAGKYDVEVGWDVEPALVGQLNGASIQIYRTGTQTPVEGVDQTLKVQIAFGGGTAKEFPLHSVEDKMGYYVADIIPTKPGDYIFTFVGNIEGTAVNEQFESGPGRFDSVTTSDALEFPATPPDAAALQAELDTMRANQQLITIGVGISIILSVIAIILVLVSSRRRK